MNNERRILKILGGVFLLVVFTSLSSNLLLGSIIRSETISDMLHQVAEKGLLIRISVIIELFTAVGIIVLAVLLFTVLKKENRILATIALGWWIAEAIILAIGKTGSLGLIYLSGNFISSGADMNEFYNFMGDFLYNGFDRMLNTFHMLFYCLGGIIWYSLFFKSSMIPRFISLFGLISVSISLLGIIAAIGGATVPIFVHLPILPFELAIGFYLLIHSRTERQ